MKSNVVACKALPCFLIDDPLQVVGPDRSFGVLRVVSTDAYHELLGVVVLFLGGSAGLQQLGLGSALICLICADEP